MRRALIPWLLFGLALVAIVVPMAQGTSSAKDPRVAGLIKKVNVLQKQVAALVVNFKLPRLSGRRAAGHTREPGWLPLQARCRRDAAVALHGARRPRHR